MPLSDALRSYAAELGRLVVPVVCPGCGAPDVPWCSGCVAALAPGPPRRVEADAPRLDRLDGVAPLPVWACASYVGPVRELLPAWKDQGRLDLTPLMVVRTFGEEVWKLTVLELAFSIGMLLGGAVIAAWATRRSRVGLIAGSTVVFGVLSVGMGLSTNMWVFFGLMFLLGLAVPFFSTPSMTVLQETVEPQMQGRVFGFVGIVMALAMPTGMAAFGPLADRFSVESLLVAAGIALFVVVGAAVAAPSGRRAMAAAEDRTRLPAAPTVGGP